MKKSSVVVAGFCIAVLFAGCAQEGEKKGEGIQVELDPAERRSVDFVGEVVSATNAGRYVYLEIKKTTGDGDIVWVAANSMDVKAGDKVSVLSGVLMVDFYSPTLKRKFESIYFTGHVLQGDFTEKESAACPVEPAGGDSTHEYHTLSSNAPSSNPHSFHGNPHAMPKDAIHGNPHGSGGIPKGSYHDVHGMPGDKK